MKGSRVENVTFRVAEGMPVAVLLQEYERFDSGVQKRLAHQMIAALRKQFGGHAVRAR